MKRDLKRRRDAQHVRREAALRIDHAHDLIKEAATIMRKVDAEKADAIEALADVVFPHIDGVLLLS